MNKKSELSISYYKLYCLSCFTEILIRNLLEMGSHNLRVLLPDRGNLEDQEDLEYLDHLVLLGGHPFLGDPTIIGTVNKSSE